MFDILFRNAKVIDGTGNPWFYGDVGVEGGTVAAVLPPGSTARARRVADVDGKALCPGFVDGHSHSELPLLAGEGMDCKIMQGVTTENLGLDGMSLAPIKDGDKADWKKHLSGLAGTLDVPFLLALPRVFVFVALGAWAATFAGLLGSLARAFRRTDEPA